MIIKDCYIKNDIDKTINIIINYLIRNNIKFLYIKDSNELHFENYILRFKKYTNLKIFLINDFLNIINSITNKNYNEYLNYKEYTIINNNEKNNNFKNIQKINNIKIDTKGKVKKLNKQLNPTRKIYK